MTFPKTLYVCNKEHWFRHRLAGDILLGLDISFYAQPCPEPRVSCCACEMLQLRCLREAGCLLAFPWVYSLDKTQAAQLDSAPGRKQHYSSFLAVVRLKGCCPCVLMNISNALLLHPDISCAKGCLPIPHSLPAEAQADFSPVRQGSAFHLRHFYLKIST